MESTSLEEIAAEIEDYISRKIAGGFGNARTIEAAAVDVYSYDGHDPVAIKSIAAKLTAAAVVAHRRAQQEWPEVTDCDLLDRAFAELERAGIVARQDFSCCGNCGLGEIGDEIDAAANTGVNVRGFTFYHMQDTDAAAAGHGLYLYYGGVEAGVEPALRIGHEIVDAMQRHGLKTIWDGSIERRIQVHLDWKRRLSE